MAGSEINLQFVQVKVFAQFIDIPQRCLNSRHSFFAYVVNKFGAASFVGCVNDPLNSHTIAIGVIVSCDFREFNDEKVNGDARDYIKKKIKQAEWFMKSLEQRQKTLYLVSKSIVDFQSEFFERGIRHLKPLILKDVAHYIGVHESTVSRITTNKYMGTPSGVYEMKFFFTTGVGSDFGEAVSTDAVMDLIAEIISKEDRKNPLKDEEIVALLKNQHNIGIARRTVAKYREVLHIQSSRERRRLD